MKRYKKYLLFLLLVLCISLTIIVINDNNDKLIPKIIQDINSGVIGAILTTIITLLLLSNQTESQENLTKSSVVYEEKLRIFNGFLENIGSCLEDGNLTALETKKIIHSFSILRIHLSTENAIKLEKAISSIDNSFFYCDEYSTPNLTRLTQLYNDISNVFKQELYGETLTELETFDFENLKKVLYRPRLSIIKPDSFDELLLELNSHSKILHTGKTSGITIVYDVNSELIHALTQLNIFMIGIVKEVSTEIKFSYEINRQIISNETFGGIPWIKLHYNGVYFAYYGLSETKRLWIGKIFPEKKQIASLELYESDNLTNLSNQIIGDFKNIISEIHKQNIEKSAIQ